MSSLPTVRIDDDTLEFAFPDVHSAAKLRIDFQRTLRIPDDDRVYPLPPGLGCFPLRDVDDYAERIPAKWAERGGVMLPMYQSEALWLSFGSSGYPFAVKVTTGSVCCLTGSVASAGLERDPQNYVVVPVQPWLDGYNVGGDRIRQFVAAPLDSDASVEKQIRGEASDGGMQLEVRPMTAAAWAAHERARAAQPRFDGMVCSAPATEMGFAAGGQMRQEIYADPYQAHEWSDAAVSCNVWVANSLVWRDLTGERPPTKPFSARDYARADLPWFDYLDDRPLVRASGTLAALRSYKAGRERAGFAVTATRVVELRRRQGLQKSQVRTRRT